MLVQWQSLDGLYKRTAQCKKWLEWKQQHLAAEEARTVVSREFIAYRRPFVMVPSFKFLGRLKSAADDDWPEVIRNLMKGRMIWRRMSRILSWEGVRLLMSVFFFKAVDQSLLLFGEETEAVTTHMGRVLQGFQDQLTRRLMGQMPQWRLDVRW